MGLRQFERPIENTRIVAGVFVSAVSLDQLARLRRANPTPARPRLSKPRVAGSGTPVSTTDFESNLPSTAL